MKHIALTIIGTVCLALGALGLIVPLIPGFLFLLIAAAAFAQLFPSVRRRLDRHPRMNRFFQRVDASEPLGLLDQMKMTVLASIEAITQPTRRR